MRGGGNLFFRGIFRRVFACIYYFVSFKPISLSSHYSLYLTHLTTLTLISFSPTFIVWLPKCPSLFSFGRRLQSFSAFFINNSFVRNIQVIARFLVVRPETLPDLGYFLPVTYL